MDRIKSDRIEFTKEMKQKHTILIPMMLPIHFSLLQNILKNEGYNVVLLSNCSPSVVETGLKYVQNDTCYPALLVIGQMIDALNSGEYDLENTSLIITQTGGGCRASNYIHLLRKALKRAGYGKIPVISLNTSGMEKNSGFSLTLPLLRRMLSCVVYGDCLMLLLNQTKPYELVSGESDALVAKWVSLLTKQFANGDGMSISKVKKNLSLICTEFARITRHTEKKVRVGIVGEIYVKYAALANNNLEDFLTQEENCEIDVPGLMGFILYCSDNYLQGTAIYGEHKLLSVGVKALISYMLRLESAIIDAVAATNAYHLPTRFYEAQANIKTIIGTGVKMGEGWLLTAEMVELIKKGVENIICTQPFGCLPNHISGKGMLKKLKDLYPTANIVPIDYDPGATKVNQENRIKLMLAMAREQQINTQEREEMAEKANKTKIMANL